MKRRLVTQSVLGRVNIQYFQESKKKVGVTGIQRADKWFERAAEDRLYRPGKDFQLQKEAKINIQQGCDML